MHTRLALNLGLLGILALAGCDGRSGPTHGNDPRIPPLTSDTFDAAVAAEGIAVVDFWIPN